MDSNINESKYVNQILFYIIESIINILKGKEIDEFLEDILYENDDLINFEDFDNNIKFYTYIITSFQNIYYKKITLSNIQPIINQRNFLIFLNCLNDIIKRNKNAYKNSIIKINIYLIISYFSGNKTKEIINSDEYFFICQKEIEKIYKINLDENIVSDFDRMWLNEYKCCINLFKKIQLNNIIRIFSFIKNYYIKNKMYDYFDEITKILNKLKGNKSNLNIEDEIIYNEKYKNYFDFYIENSVKNHGYNKENPEYNLKKEQLKKNLFDFKDIFNFININDKLYLLSVSSSYDSTKAFNNIIDNFNNFKNNYELLINESKEDLTEDFKNILNDKKFYNKFKNILESNTVKTYLLNKRKFNHDNKIEIINNQKEYNDDLSDGYKNFMNYYNKNTDCFNKLIIIKYLPKYKRAFVDPNMRIIINPLFIEITKELNNDKDKKNEIFQSYIIIIIIHEIIHLHKFMKSNNFSLENLRQTQKI